MDLFVTSKDGKDTCCLKDKGCAKTVPLSPVVPELCCKIGEDGTIRCFRVGSTSSQSTPRVSDYHLKDGPRSLTAACCKFVEDGHLECSKICDADITSCQHNPRVGSGCGTEGDGARSAIGNTLFWIWVLEVASGMHCTIEGIASIILASKDRQLSLLLFGLDSVIEVASVLLVMWRLSGRQAAQRRERIATGGIGALLLLLMCAAIAASIVHLVEHDRPETAVAGVVISCISTMDMVCFWLLKRHLAKKVQSKCLASDATCSLVCALLGAVLFIGSIVFLLRPSVWWIDAAAALLLSVFIGKEGFGMLRNACSANFEIGGCC